jgi:hypothetical protein
MASKATVLNAVLSSASKNSELLNRISSTSEAPALLHGHNIHQDRVSTALAEQDTLLASLKSDVDTLARSSHKLRDSRFRRLYHRATRMLDTFEARAADEEKRYFAALAERSRAEERRAALAAELAQAESERLPLEKAAKEHEDAHVAIDELYERLFAGPTPGFGQEDQKEGAFYAARDRNEGTKQKIVSARRALRVLESTVRYLDRAESCAEEAGQEAREAVFFFDDAQRLLRYTVRYCQAAVASVERATEAFGEDLPPEMRNAEGLTVQKLRDAERLAQASHADESVIPAITATGARLDEARRSLGRFQELVKQREDAGLVEIKQTARAREDWRQSLYQVRMRIFEEVAGFGEAAPAYTECCDRTAGYCLVPEEAPAHQEENIDLSDEREGLRLPRPPCSNENTQQAPPAYRLPSLTAVTTSRLELPPARSAQLTQPLNEKQPVPHGPESLDSR